MRDRKLSNIILIFTLLKGRSTIFFYKKNLFKNEPNTRIYTTLKIHKAPLMFGHYHALTMQKYLRFITPTLI